MPSGWNSTTRDGKMRRRFVEIGDVPGATRSSSSGDSIEDIIDSHADQIDRINRLQSTNTVLLVLVLFLCAGILVGFGGWNIYQTTALYGYGRNDHKIDNIEDELVIKCEEISVLQGNVTDLDVTLNSINITANGTSLVGLITCVDPICTDAVGFYQGIDNTSAAVTALESCTSTICSDPSGFYGNISTLQGDVTDLETCTSTFCVDPLALSNDIDALEADVAILQNCTNGLCSNISGFFTSVDVINDTVTDLVVLVGQLNTTVIATDDCISPICNNATEFFNGIDTLETKVADLENCTSTFCADPDALSGGLANVTSQVSTLESTVAALVNCTADLCANPELLFAGGSGGGVVYLAYTSAANTSFVVPVNVTRVYAALVGGGGGGGSGGNSANAPSTTNPILPNAPGEGGGGGGCAYPAEQFITVTPGEFLTVIIGAGGLGSVSPFLDGASGEDSEIYRGATLLVQSKGGGKGRSGLSGDGTGGGPGGSASSGDGGNGLFGGGAGATYRPSFGTNDGGIGVWVDGRDSSSADSLNGGAGAPPRYGLFGGGLGGFTAIANATLEGYRSGSGGGGASPQPFLHYSFKANGFAGNGANGIPYEVLEPIAGQPSVIAGGGGGGGSGGYGRSGFVGHFGSEGGDGGGGHVVFVY